MVNGLRNAMSAAIRAVCLALLVSQMMQGAQARQPERSVLFIECPSQTGALCQALVRSIASHVPSHIIRLDPHPADIKAMRVTFHLVQNRNPFSGYLSWRTGDGALGQGPVHEKFDGNVVASSISAQEFAETLVSELPELKSILAASK